MERNSEVRPAAVKIVEKHNALPQAKVFETKIARCLSRDMSEIARFLKSTLRLPTSKFPPRPPPAEIPKYLSRCDDLYAWQLRERPATDKNIFTLHDGPPYANGDLHVGHALNKIIKDIICRTKLAEGKRINYVPGWDCHGLPIELKALEKHGWTGNQAVDAIKVRAAARSFAHNTVRKQMKGFRSWGVMGDWDGHWKTMDKDFELRQLTVFKAMAEHGLIYRKHKPVYWSPSSQTALAEAELEYKDDHISTAAIVKFLLRASIDGLNEPAHLVIWTTTPWTLPANQAVAINKGLEYIIATSQKHGKLVIAKSRLSFLEEQLQEELQIWRPVPSNTLIAGSYVGGIQFDEAQSNRPIYHADFVSAESGTGLVHCAPGHGPDDYVALQPLIKKGRVEVKAPVDDLGRFTAAACPRDPELLHGKNVFTDGNRAVLNLLQRDDSLLSSYEYRHKYAIDWRTKEPVMIRATAQWFADITDIKTDVLNSMNQVQFLPPSGQSRLESFVANRSEWCISRQRAWGVPIPALYHKDTGEPVLTGESIDHIIRTINERGIDAWWSDGPNDPAWVVSGLSPDDYIRGKDTMDVWFDSGTSWSFITKLKDSQPQTQHVADVYLEGSDQHRGWFQSSILTSIAYQKSTFPNASAYAPFAQLITHGFTLDGEGKKMSKSLGNVVEPDQIINGLAPGGIKQSKKGKQVHPLGPDALRLWAASSDWTKDVIISDQVISTVHKSLDKYRITFKLLLGMLGDFDPTNQLSYQSMKSLESDLDRYALVQLYNIVQNVRMTMSSFEFHKALSMINEWIARDLSGFYFESVKDIVYCDSITSKRRLSAQTVLYHIFCQMQHMLGAIIPLLVEETVDFTPEAIRSFSDHPLKRIWSSLPDEWNDKRINILLPFIMTVNSGVKAAQEKGRSEKVIGQSLASEVVLMIRDDLGLSSVNAETWREVLVVSKVKVGTPSNDLLESFANSKTEDERSELRDSIARSVMEDSEKAWSFCYEVGSPTDGTSIGYVLVESPSDTKCARCWRYLVPETSTTDPALCERCDDVVKNIR